MTPPSNREKDIFLQALEKKTDQERKEFLDAACGDDPKLRRQVEELLESFGDAESVLGAAAAQAAEEIIETFESKEIEPSSPTLEGPGAVIGPYKLMEQIGEGGFGLVFVAEQQQPVRRRVALKLIKPGMDSHDVINRFEGERQALAMMNHPNIARVLDAGATDTGRPYFVMELVTGVPITEYCDKSRISPDGRLELFVSVCRAIQHAHQKGIIHRDIKPSNVLVTTHDGEPVAKVIDFGVAKALNQQLTHKTVYTKFAQMIGTPMYMSPEQAEMSHLDVDTRSDIYSLGVLLYELLTGSTPFDRERLAKAAFDEIRRIIREEDPPKPSTRLSTSGDRLPSLAAQRKIEPGKLPSLMRGELDWIVMKALEKDRNRRYETANGLAADILRYLSNDTVMACPPTAGYRLRKFARRHKTLIATSTIVATSLLAGIAISGWQAMRALKAEGRAARAADDAQENARKANGLAAQAVASEKKLRASEGKLRQQVYASDMNVAGELFASGAIDRMNDRLEIHRPSESKENDERGIEWYHWWRAGHLESGKVRHPSTAAFKRLAVSPDGATIALSGWPRNVFLYDSDSLCPRRAPIQCDGEASYVCFSPDGRFLVVGAGWRSFGSRVLETKSWETVAILPGDLAVIAFAAEKPLMAIGSWDTIQLWNCGSSWHSLGRWETPLAGKVEQLEFTPDGQLLVALVDTPPGQNRRLEVWDVEKGNLIKYLGVEDPPAASSMAMSPRGNSLAVGEKDGDVQVWTADSFSIEGPSQPRRKLTASAPIASLAFSPDGKRLVAGVSESNNLLIWELGEEGNQEPLIVHAHSRRVNDIGFGKDANTVYSAGDDGYLKRWNLSSCRPCDVVRDVDPFSQIGFADDDSLIFLDANGKIQIRTISTGRHQSFSGDPQPRYHRIALSDDAAYVAGVSRNNQLRVWNSASRGKIHETAVTAESDCRLLVSRDGHHVVYITKRRSVEDTGFADIALIDLEHGVWTSARDLSLFDRASLGRPAFSTDGKQLVIQRHGYFRFSSHLLDITSDKITQRLQVSGHGPENCAAFSPDGRTLAIGSYNYGIRLHDAVTGALKHTLRGHTDQPRCLAFGREGDRLVSGGDDATVRVWKIGDAECRLLSTLREHSTGIQFVAVSPNGTSLASVDNEGTLMIWRTASQKEVETNADRRLQRAQELGPTDEAFADLDVAQGIAPDDCQILALRGRLRYERGDWDAAIEDFTRALEFIPDNAYLLQLRAEAHNQSGRLDDSLRDWNRLVQLTEGKNSDYLLGRGECYLALGRRANGVADLSQAIAVNLMRPTILERVELSISRAGVIVPVGSVWRYATDRDANDRDALTGDVSDWPLGVAPFGTGTIQSIRAKTRWANSPDIWLRRSFELSEAIEGPLVFHVLADDAAKIYVNGELVANADHSAAYQTVEWNGYLPRGKNSIAVHCRDVVGTEAAAVDVGLYTRADASIQEQVRDAAEQQLSTHSLFEPGSPEQLRFSIDQFAWQHRWPETADALARLVEADRDDSTARFATAVMHAYNEDFDAYHQLSARSLADFADTRHANDARHIVESCLIVAPREEDLVTVGSLIDRASKLDVRHDDVPWWQFAKALYEYRRGNGQASLEGADKALANSGGFTLREALCVGVMAMAHAQLHDRDASREAELELERLIQRHSPFQLRTTPGVGWHYWLVCEIFLREIREARTNADEGGQARVRHLSLHENPASSGQQIAQSPPVTRVSPAVTTGRRSDHAVTFR